MSDVPEPGTERYARAVHVLWSGRYDDLTAAEAVKLIDSDERLPHLPPLPHEGVAATWRAAVDWRGYGDPPRP